MMMNLFTEQDVDKKWGLRESELAKTESLGRELSGQAGATPQGLVENRRFMPGRTGSNRTRSRVLSSTWRRMLRLTTLPTRTRSRSSTASLCPRRAGSPTRLPSGRGKRRTLTLCFQLGPRTRQPMNTPCPHPHHPPTLSQVLGCDVGPARRNRRTLRDEGDIRI